MPLDDLNALLERVEMAYRSADRSAPGAWVFSAHIQPIGGDGVCIVVLAKNDRRARESARRNLK